MITVVAAQVFSFGFLINTLINLKVELFSRASEQLEAVLVLKQFFLTITNFSFQNMLPVDKVNHIRASIREVVANGGASAATAQPKEKKR